MPDQPVPADGPTDGGHHRHVIVCGVDHLGLRTIEELLLGEETVVAIGREPDPAWDGHQPGVRLVVGDFRREETLAAAGVATAASARGVPVVVVERSEDARFGAAARAAGIPVVVADARLPAVLDDLGLRTSRALVAVTTDDLANLTAALNARSVRGDFRVVVRVFDPDFAARVRDGFKIRFTRSVSHLAAPAFAAATMGCDVTASVPVGDRRVVLFARRAIPAGSGADGIPAATMDRDGRRRLLAIVDPDGRVRWDPPPDEVLDAGASVLVAATRVGLAELIDLARAPD